MHEWLYKLGLRLSQVGFFRSAIEDRADLSAFDGRPTFKVILGVFMIAFSFVMGWPAISTLGGVALYFRQPWIAVVGGPLLYGLSHLCFLGGMALSGAKYARIFMRWFARVWVERLLSHGLARSEIEDMPPC